ncbi:unnamed protein product [Caenorhabditis brenneri]
MFFPLFKLPYLALRNAVLQMKVYEMVDISFCSRKSRRIVSNLARNQFHAAVRANMYMSFIDLFGRNLNDSYSIFNTTDFEPWHIASETKHTRTINGVEVPFFSPQVSLWENPLEGCLCFAGHLITLFGNEVIEKMQLRARTEAEVVLIKDWLQKWKPTIKSFEVIWEDASVRVQSKLVESLMQKLNVTESLRMLIPSTSCIITRKLKLKYIELQSRCTLNSLLNIDSEAIRIGGISSLDLNKSLLNWKNGGSQNLKTLVAKFKLEWAVLTNGVTRILGDSQTDIHFSMENINGVKATIRIITGYYARERYQDKIEFMVQQELPGHNDS